MTKRFVISLTLLLALQSTSGKSVSSQPGCEPEVLLDCTKRLEALNSDTALNLGASEQDLEKVCPTLEQGMKCINNYSVKCLPANIQTYFQSMYNGTISVISELCKPGQFQNEYLKHAPCMDEAKLEYKVCVDQYNNVMGSINPLAKEQRSANIKIMCCSFTEYIGCSNHLVSKRCGEDTANFTKSLLDRLASPIIQEHCQRHFDGERECKTVMDAFHIHGSGHEHHDTIKPGSVSVWDGGVGESEPSPNNIPRDDHQRESAAAEAEPSSNSGSSSLTKIAVTLISPMLLLLALL